MLRWRGGELTGGSHEGGEGKQEGDLQDWRTAQGAGRIRMSRQWSLRHWEDGMRIEKGVMEQGVGEGQRE